MEEEEVGDNKWWWGKNLEVRMSSQMLGFLIKSLPG
jgi:hypothetical protein